MKKSKRKKPKVDEVYNCVIKPGNLWVPHDVAPESVRRLEKALGGKFVTRLY